MPCRQFAPKVGPARFGLATFRLSAGRSNRAKLRARRIAEEEDSTQTLSRERSHRNRVNDGLGFRPELDVRVLLGGITASKRLLSPRQIGRLGTKWRSLRPSSR